MIKYLSRDAFNKCDTTKHKAGEIVIIMIMKNEIIMNILEIIR